MALDQTGKIEGMNVLGTVNGEEEMGGTDVCKFRLIDSSGSSFSQHIL